MSYWLGALLVALLAVLISLVVVVIAAGVDSATAVKLPEAMLALVGAVAGAAVPALGRQGGES